MEARKSDRPVVDVLIPEHDIPSGVIQLIVIASKLGRIRVEGVDADTEKYIRSQIRMRKGEAFRSAVVMRDLSWLYHSPYRKVDFAYTPGADYGTTDMIVKPLSSDPTSFLVGHEDSGFRFLGPECFVTGF